MYTVEESAAGYQRHGAKVDGVKTIYKEVKYETR